MLRINARRLKFSSDSQPIDFVLVETCQVVRGGGGTTKFDLAAVGFCATGDQIEERGFARAIRSNDGPQFALVEVERKIRDRFESVVGLRNIFDG